MAQLLKARLTTKNIRVWFPAPTAVSPATKLKKLKEKEKEKTRQLLKEVFKRKLLAALFVIIRTWKQPRCPS